jgi:hypothetical protein
VAGTGSHTLILLVMMGITETQAFHLGDVFNCQNRMQERIIGFQEIDFCQKNIYQPQHLRTRVLKYSPKEHQIPIYLCRKWQTDSVCKENYIWAKDEDRSTIVKATSKTECRDAVNTKMTTYGKLKQTEDNSKVWRTTNAAHYDCRYGTNTDDVTFIYEVKELPAYVTRNDYLIHQDVTATRCSKKNLYCQPRETKRWVIIWNAIPPIPPTYQPKEPTT